jgi:quercetin dioxygenase-like cupin family protein
MTDYLEFVDEAVAAAVFAVQRHSLPFGLHQRGMCRADTTETPSGHHPSRARREQCRLQSNLLKDSPREEFMNRLIIPAMLVAAGLAATAAWSQPTTPQLQNKRYFTMPLEKDPTREVGLQSVTMPPGAGNQFHRHPGDQWTAVQEGEVTFTVKGKPPQVLKAGDYNYVPRGTIHRQQNLSGKPARYIEMRIFDKDKPAAEQVGE